MKNPCQSRPRVLPLCIALALLEISPALAACNPSGTPQNDAIVCTGAHTDGVAADAGNDSVTVTSGALIMLDFFGIRDPKAFAVDAGDDDDTVFSLGIDFRRRHGRAFTDTHAAGVSRLEYSF